MKKNCDDKIFVINRFLGQQKKIEIKIFLMTKFSDKNLGGTIFCNEKISGTILCDQICLIKKNVI